MADLLLLIPAALCLWGLKWTRGLNRECLDRDGTDALRGALALGIIFVHIAQYCPGGWGFALTQRLGYLLVAGFFFLSGYSLQSQHMAKKDYARGFLRKRLLGVLVPYLVITAVYWSYFQLIGRKYGWLDILSRFAQGNPIVSFSWFIPGILTFYLAFWAVMRLCRGRGALAVLGGGVWFVGYTLICILLEFGQWWYVSAFPAVLGMAWAVYRKPIDDLLRRRYWWALVLLLGTFAGVVILENAVQLGVMNTVLKSCAATLFAAGLVLVLYRVRLGNPVLRSLGRMSMELYLMQGLAIMVLRSRWLYVESPLLYGLLILVLTVVFAAVVHIAFKGIPKKPTQ